MAGAIAKDLRVARMAPKSNGTLTDAERQSPQGVANKYQTELEVYRSRARGEGRNIDTDLPVGKEPPHATRSDIDVRYDGDVEIRTGGAFTDDLKNIGGGKLIDARPYWSGRWTISPSRMHHAFGYSAR
jgi:hypothetical protein